MDSGSDSLSSNCEFEGKGNQNVLLCDRVNGLQQQGIESDSFVVDMDRFEEEIYKKSRIKVSFLLLHFICQFVLNNLFSNFISSPNSYFLASNNFNFG